MRVDLQYALKQLNEYDYDLQIIQNMKNSENKHLNKNKYSF